MNGTIQERGESLVTDNKVIDKIHSLLEVLDPTAGVQQMATGCGGKDPDKPNKGGF